MPFEREETGAPDWYEDDEEGKEEDDGAAGGGSEAEAKGGVEYEGVDQFDSDGRGAASGGGASARRRERQSGEAGGQSETRAGSVHGLKFSDELIAGETAMREVRKVREQGKSRRGETGEDRKSGWRVRLARVSSHDVRRHRTSSGPAHRRIFRLSSPFSSLSSSSSRDGKVRWERASTLRNREQTRNGPPQPTNQLKHPRASCRTI